MAIDYDNDILPFYATSVVTDDEYSSIDADLRDQTNEQRILTTIEVIKAHLYTIGNRTESNLLLKSIGRLLERIGSGGNVYDEEIIEALGNVTNATFAAGAGVDLTVPSTNGTTFNLTAPLGGDADETAAQLNSTLFGATVEASNVTVTADTDGSLGGVWWGLSNSTTDYYFWYNVPERQETFTIDWTGITGATLPTGAVAAAYFDATSTTGGYRFWFSDGSTVAPAAGGNTLVPIAFTGAETDQQISDLVVTAITGADSDFVNADNAGGTTQLVTCQLVTAGSVTDVVDGAVATGAVFAVPTQGITASVDPAPASRVGVQIDISAGASSTTVASETATAIENTGDTFATSLSSSPQIDIINAEFVNVTDIAAGTSGFVVNVTQQGSTATLSPEVEFFATSSGQLGARNTSGNENTSFTLEEGSGGILKPAGIIEGEYRSQPEKVANRGRDQAISAFETQPRDPVL